MLRFLSLLAALAVATPAAQTSAPPAHPSPAASSRARPSPSHPPSARPSSVPSPSVAPGGSPTFGVGVWTVHASSVDANFKTGEFSTPNKVVMTRAGGDVTADRANGNYKKKLVYLNGHVVMHDLSGTFGNGSAPPSHAQAPSTLTADKAQIDGLARTYMATGNVHYVQADTVVDADSGTLDDVAHELFLKGNVHVRQGSRSLIADTVNYNTITGDAHAEGNVTMQFPGEIHRTLATPKPIKLGIPKNPVLKPAGTPPT